jgi:hypothetical protein
VSVQFSNLQVWAQRYCSKLQRLLVPEWTVKVTRSKVPLEPGKFETVDGEVSIDQNFMEADIVLGPCTRNNVDGRTIICHEFVHILLYDLGLTSEETIEERTVTRLARVIEKLT